MKKMIFCILFLFGMAVLPANAKTDQESAPGGAVKQAAQAAANDSSVNATARVRVQAFTTKVFKNTIHSVEGSSLKIGRIIALFVFCGLGAIVLLFALI
ncbi:MAG TPA: hypothetical protein VD905_07635 [Flavobacteriales bacterium]|nr:hypothetical protein [Flavobacteriales bacterium]